MMFLFSNDSNKKIGLGPVKSFVQTVFIPVCVFIISLGSFSEAFLLVDDLRVMLKTRFSNDFEYETLNSIHVGNTEAYVEDLIGSPAATKPLGDDTQANYYLDEKYLLTTYIKAGRVEAYTVVAIADDFSPELAWFDGMNLQDEAFDGFGSDTPQAFTFDKANTNSFFLELSPSELSGFFQNSYLGAVQYGAGSVDQAKLEELYEAEVFGSESDTLEKIKVFRKAAVPNFYGQGELKIEVIRQGLLSNGEFLNFFQSMQ
jgi:hypothetical protein